VGWRLSHGVLERWRLLREDEMGRMEKWFWKSGVFAGCLRGVCGVFGGLMEGQSG